MEQKECCFRCAFAGKDGVHCENAHCPCHTSQSGETAPYHTPQFVGAPRPSEIERILREAKQNSGDWETVWADFTNHVRTNDEVKNFLRTEIDRAERRVEEKAYAEGFINGQKHAFGVDRKRVFEEGREAMKKELREKVETLKKSYRNTGEPLIPAILDDVLNLL